jgi:hypothetical protein
MDQIKEQAGEEEVDESTVQTTSRKFLNHSFFIAHSRLLSIDYLE